MAVSKIKLANKKFKHEQRRKAKARAERLRTAHAIEARGRRVNERRRNAGAYVGALGADLDI